MRIDGAPGSASFTALAVRVHVRACERAQHATRTRSRRKKSHRDVSSSLMASIAASLYETLPFVRVLINDPVLGGAITRTVHRCDSRAAVRRTHRLRVVLGHDALYKPREELCHLFTICRHSGELRKSSNTYTEM